MKKMLMLASVPSVIGQFHMPNIRILQEMGYQVTVACNFLDRSIWNEERTVLFEKELEEKGIRKCQIDFERSPVKLLQHLKAYGQLKRQLVREQYDFIHCHTPVGGVLARIAGHKTGTGVIYTAHGFHFFQGAPVWQWLLFYPIERFLSGWTDLLITINAEDYKRAKGFHASKVEYIPGVGVDVDRFAGEKADRAGKRKELGIPENAYLCLSVGELSKRKNHEIVLRALGRLKDPDIYYVICGQGEKRKRLQNIAVEEGIADKVKLIGHRLDVLEIYKAADVFIYPSLQEGLPVALTEALACGLPCICSDIRGNRDLISNKRWLLSNSMESYARAIQKMRKHPQVQPLETLKSFDLKYVEKKTRLIYKEFIENKEVKQR